MPNQVACPHCGEPLTVVWEIYREWQVLDTGTGWILGGEPDEYEGGACENCHKWVDEPPQNVVRPRASGA